MFFVVKRDIGFRSRSPIIVGRYIGRFRSKMDRMQRPRNWFFPFFFRGRIKKRPRTPTFPLDLYTLSLRYLQIYKRTCLVYVVYLVGYSSQNIEASKRKSPCRRNDDATLNEERRISSLTRWSSVRIYAPSNCQIDSIKISSLLCQRFMYTPTLLTLEHLIFSIFSLRISVIEETARTSKMKDQRVDEQ